MLAFVALCRSTTEECSEPIAARILGVILIGFAGCCGGLLCACRGFSCGGCVLVCLLLHLSHGSIATVDQLLHLLDLLLLCSDRILQLLDFAGTG